jgi:hypothetical protein
MSTVSEAMGGDWGRLEKDLRWILDKRNNAKGYGKMKAALGHKPASAEGREFRCAPAGGAKTPLLTSNRPKVIEFPLRRAGDLVQRHGRLNL